MRYSWLLLCLGLAACGGDSEKEVLHSVYAYDSSSNYSDHIVECVKAYQTDESCYLDVLPPLSRSTNPVTVDQIMSRLVISHDWMATRFRQVLEQSPQAALDLFAPLTAVVISYDIIPAFYTIDTGAIYLDPRYLWTTPDEYNTIAEKEDYRADFGNDLALDVTFWYEDQAGFYISLDNTPDAPVQRSISAVIPNIMRLLFHELAHANDFLPPSWRTQLQLPAGDLAYYDAVVQAWNNNDTVQRQLDQLSDSTLLALAQVMYQGEAASNELITLSAYRAGDLFANEGANDHYAYSTPAEDVAMLLEEALMSFSYDATRSVFFLEKTNSGSEGFCSGYNVGWGQQGRISDSLVQPRAEQVISLILPNLADEIQQHLDSLAGPFQYPEEGSLCDHLASSRSSYSATPSHELSRLKLPRHEHKPVKLPF